MITHPSLAMVFPSLNGIPCLSQVVANTPPTVKLGIQTKESNFCLELGALKNS